MDGNWVVTGGSGFLGRHLLPLLRPGSRGNPVWVVGRSRPDSWPPEAFAELDLTDPVAVTRLFEDLRPSHVFHLAGRTPPAGSSDFYRANLLGTLHLLDALRPLGRKCRVVLVGSAAELGPVPVEELPVGEDRPCRPSDAYGLSKWLATKAGLVCRPPLEVMVARVFNPIGPGLPTSQAFGRFARELARGDGRLRLTVGNLDARRDFVDVRDVAAALLAIADRGRAGRLYHVGTGESRRVGDGLSRLIEFGGRDVILEPDPTISGGSTSIDSRADVGRIRDEVGWSARIPWETSLRDLWLGAIERSRAGLTDPDSSV